MLYRIFRVLSIQLTLSNLQSGLFDFDKYLFVAVTIDLISLHAERVSILSQSAS
jgi:hypothetical protein